MRVREHENEPVPGLPEALPEGERILWQGAPRWLSLAKSALHLRGVAIYLALIVAWGATSAFANHDTTTEALVVASRIAGIAMIAIAGLALFAHLMARSTLYTITNRRIVMRFGVALPITMNIPLPIVESAGVKINRDGTGDIPLTLSVEERQSFAVLWPNVRPWRTTKPEPMLRSVPDAQHVAEVLGSALRVAAGEPGVVRVRAPRVVRVDSEVAAPSGQTVAA